MMAVVRAPAGVTTIVNISLRSGTIYVIKPDWSCSRAVFVAYNLSIVYESNENTNKITSRAAVQVA